MPELSRSWRLPLAGALVFVAAVTAAPRNAWAHAVLQKSLPAANASVAGGSVPILLTYSSRIDGAHSKLELLAPDGTSARLEIAGKSEPNVLRSEAHGLRPGHYVLQWQVIATDGHITRGAVPFNVK